MNGIKNDSGDTSMCSDRESKDSEGSDNESEGSAFKIAPERPVDEINWSNASVAGSSDDENQENMNITPDSEMSNNALDPLASPQRRKSTSSAVDAKSGSASPARSGSASPDNARSGSASPNNVNNVGSASTSSVNVGSRSASPSLAVRSGCASPNHEGSEIASHSVITSSIHILGGPSSPPHIIGSSASPTRIISSRASPTHIIGCPASPTHIIGSSASPMRITSESPNHTRSGSRSPNISGDPFGSPNAPRRGSSSSMQDTDSLLIPVGVRSAAVSPVNIKDSDSEDDLNKSTNMIDSESDDDCILVEEGKKKEIPEKKQEPEKPPVEHKPDPQANGDVPPIKESEDSQEGRCLRRSLRNTKRKSYRDELDIGEEEKISSDSESEAKKNKVTVMPQIKLVNTSLLMNKAPVNRSMIKPVAEMVNRGTQNGVSKSVLTTMAQRGVSISSMARPGAAKKPLTPPVPPPFPKDSAFATMTNGQSLVEAPSFLSPLIYVKKPLMSLRKFVDELGEEVLKEQKKRELEEMEEKRIKEEERLKKEALKKQNEVRRLVEEEAKRLEDAPAAIETTENENAETAENQNAETAMDVDDELSKVTDEQKDAEKIDNESTAKADEPKKKGRKRRKAEENDESWDEDESESSEDEPSDEDAPETVIIKDKPDEDNLDVNKLQLLDTPKPPETPVPDPVASAKFPEKPKSYFNTPLGSFFIDIGTNLVQERVHTNLFNMQQRRMRKGSGTNKSMEGVMQFLSSNIQRLKQANFHFNFGQVRCQFCSFKTESALVMAHHMEVPHSVGNNFRCNFCPEELASPQLILAHVTERHGVTARLTKPPASFQCPECPFESGTKGRYTKHVERCLTLQVPDILKPQEWQPPAKLIKASARPNYVYNYRPRFNARSVQPMLQNRHMTPPFPQLIMNPRATRPRLPAPQRHIAPPHIPPPLISCGMCGSKWADGLRLREHVLRDHAQIISNMVPSS